MLKLIVDNTNQESSADPQEITCRNSCELYDDITVNCSIKKNVKVDDPREIHRCGHFLAKFSSSAPAQDMKRSIRFTLLEGDAEISFEYEDIFHGLVGERFNAETSVYPLKPDFSAKREDAVWYVSPCGTYGCWIVNKSEKRFVSVPSNGEVEQGWNKKVYKSPVPFHDHHSALSLASKMAWVVDLDGFGQYALLVNGKISTLPSPRPTNWKRNIDK